jgi:Ca-activated chloride channel family protein
MNEIHLQNIEMLHLLWLVSILGGLFWYASRRRKVSLELLLGSGWEERTPDSTRSSRRTWKAVAILFALVFLVAALTRPAWNPVDTTVNRQGRDVVFLLDVSRSMLAEDLAPNRLERAKLAIRDCIEQLEGDRVGLVVFAGNSVVRCPLTVDYGFFRMMLDSVTVKSVTKGGTMIGDALRKTVAEVFDDQERAFKDLILITDGQDHESFPLEAAKAVGEEGIRLIAIGLGDEEEGQPIPITDNRNQRSFLTHDGEIVKSRLDGATLRDMVKATPGGKYFNVATGTIDLGTVYQQLIAGAQKRSLQDQEIQKYEEKFQIFLATAFLLLIIEGTTADKSKEKIRA